MLLMAMLLQVAPPSPPTAPPPQDTPPDILVTAPLGSEPLPTRTLPGTNSGVQNRIKYDNSRRIAGCAMRLPPARLRAALDGERNSAPQREAQAWLVRMTVSCNSNPGIISDTRVGSSSAVNATIGAGLGSLESNLAANGIGGETETTMSISGRSIYDYGALLEAALESYAPTMTLSPRETLDPAVQARFNAREMPRNAKRLKADYQYFAVAVCLVRLQPVLATRLFRSQPGSAEETRVRAHLINGGRACVGNARKVRVDAAQFRVYAIDALYRWVLAARDVPTLLTRDTETGG